jgi:hypothetical protein
MTPRPLKEMIMDLVEVVRFTVFDIVTGEHMLSQKMAKPEVIRRIQSAVAVPGSRIEIDRRRLDGNGMIDVRLLTN